MAAQDKNIAADDPQINGSTVSKELEPQRAQEKQLLNEVVKVKERQDEEARQKIEEALGDKIRLSDSKVNVTSDVAASGVVEPQEEANKVITNGPTINIPMTEDEFNRAEKVKAQGKVLNKVVFGVPSVVAFVDYITRMVKIAHKHAKQVIFRKGEKVNAN